MELFQKTSIQSTTPLCHWIVYEEVLVLYMTIFDDWHCEYDRPWYCILRVKIRIRKNDNFSRSRAF